ncbi:MAG TPA: TonB-dependent receptor [Pyrinomonadaceae bacterium]|nr:TonB-dependent receptor [Pyrinomonadaceae bacterium]
MIHGQTDPGLSGRVVDQREASIAGAEVRLLSSSGVLLNETNTDRNGRFYFAQLPPGEYSIAASALNFGRSETPVVTPYLAAVTIRLSPAPLAAEINITSTSLAGTSASLDDIPGAIDRISFRVLETSRVFNFSEALRKVSGVNIRDEEGFGLRPNIGIRGTNPTRSTKVLLLEDGVPLTYAPYGDNASYYHPPIERYSSIEVLKGSGQIAFGPQTIAGVINYLTPTPSEKPTFNLRLIGGNRKFFNGSFTGSGTIGRTGLIAGFTRKQGDGARENISSKLNDISTKVVHSINDRHALTFKFSYYGEDSNVAYSGLREDEFAANNRYNPFENDFFYGDRFGFSISHSAVLSPRAVLTTNFYRNYFKRHWWRQASTSDHRPFRLTTDPDCTGMADLSTTCGNLGNLRQYDTTGFEPRFTFNYDIGSRFRGELQTGFRIHWETQNRRQEFGDLPTSRSGYATEINIRRNRAVSGFVQNRFVFGDIAITPGVRIESIGAERENRLADPVTFGRTTVNEVIPGIGVAYSGLPRTTLFAGIHRGFSPPRAEDLISNTGGVVELDPERSWNYEVGARTAPFRGLEFDATVFRLDYENQIVPASIAGGAGALLTNGGRTQQQGLEFSGTVESGPITRSDHSIYLRSAVTWLPTAEFRGTRFSTATSASLLNTYCPANRRTSETRCDISGNRLPYVPETLVTTTLGYSHANGLNAFMENVYLGSQFADDLNAVAPTPNGQRGLIPSQSYWNATVNYRVEKLRSTFFITGKNLSTRTYIIDRSRGILPSSPRLLQAGVSINF